MGARQLASKPTGERDSPHVSIKSSGPHNKPIRLTRQRKLRNEFLTPEFLTPSQQPKSLTLSRYNNVGFFGVFLFCFFLVFSSSFPFSLFLSFLLIYLWISCRWLNLTWISFLFIRRLFSLSVSVSVCLYLRVSLSRCVSVCLSVCLSLSPLQNHFPFWTFRFILFFIEHLGQLW